MKVKAAAFHEYNQAAVLDKLLTGMPEVVRAMAEPLSKVDKITIVSTGDGHGAGASKIVADVATMIAQAPALFETLAGIKLLERVSMLVRANLNDLIDRSEDPEKMVKQVILDLHNQYIQVKTQLAVALTEQHLVEEKAVEARAKAGEWMRKAELAVDRKEDGLAKRALERHNTFTQTGELFAEQTEEHKKDVDLLRDTLSKLEAKLREAEGKKALLVTQHRAARARARAGQAA